MNLSSDELQIVEYLKSWKGTSVSMMEICRSAGGRKRFKESPNWAKSLMSRLVEANLVLANDRGHYCAVIEVEKIIPPPPPPAVDLGYQVDDNYFPVDHGPPAVVGEDYFPAAPRSEDDTSRWISPQIAAILKKAGKKVN